MCKFKQHLLHIQVHIQPLVTTVHVHVHVCVTKLRSLTHSLHAFQDQANMSEANNSAATPPPKEVVTTRTPTPTDNATDVEATDEANLPETEPSAGYLGEYAQLD